MLTVEDRTCSKCKSSKFIYYDRVVRIVRREDSKIEYINVNRLKCTCCGSIHRDIPSFIYPHKQYHKEIIDGVKSGEINACVIGFEDYPCDMTMKRWTSQK